jgi:hypothetical protein
MTTPAERFAQCKAIAEHSEPLSDDERAAKESAIAKVRAEDERRRMPSPQLDLDAAA